MKHLCILLMLIAFCACCQQKVISQAEYNEYVKELGWDQPDSLKTPEQLKMREKVIEVAFMNTVMKNNQMRLTVDRKYFVEQDLPAICYDMIVFEYDANNRVMKEIKQTKAGKMLDFSAAFEEAKKELVNQN